MSTTNDHEFPFSGDVEFVEQSLTVPAKTLEVAFAFFVQRSLLLAKNKHRQFFSVITKVLYVDFFSAFSESPWDFTM